MSAEDGKIRKVFKILPRRKTGILYKIGNNCKGNSALFGVSVVNRLYLIFIGILSKYEGRSCNLLYIKMKIEPSELKFFHSQSKGF
jgi:hypothetical protein